MKIKLIISVLLSSLLNSCEPNVKEILQKSFKKCQTIQNGYYEMTRYTSLTNQNDTPEDIYVCYFDKLKNDSLFSSAFHLKHYKKGKHKRDVIYTGEDFIITNENDSSAKIMSKAKWFNEIKASAIKYPLFSPLVSRNSSPLPQDLDLEDRKHFFNFIGEENINNTICYHIQGNETPIDEKDSPISTLKLESHFWISKSELIPIQYSFEVVGVMKNRTADTIYQYTRDVLSKYEINNLKDKSILTFQSIPSNYEIKDYVSDTEIVPMLQIGTKAPDWTLVSLNNEIIKLNDIKGKYILIDFFYKGCYPCIQSIPAIQSLHDKYKNKDLIVIGIDPVDDNVSDLSDFLIKKGVTYTILLGNEEITKKYHVKNYPSMYLLDKNGKIIFTKYGYRKDFEKLIENIIL